MLTAAAVGLAGNAGRARAQAQVPAQVPEEKKPAAVKSAIKVTLPQDDAELLIEDKPTKATGKSREFITPQLDVGGKYEYKFSAKWRPNNYTVITRNKTLTFKAGDEIVVDLTKDDSNDKAVIRYVPTPDDIVKKMIELAKVGKDDVVFEPGCGDARITVAAVKAGAKKGVGIDLDPERVAESKETVKKAGVEGKVEIRLGDALDIKDFSDATVVFLYMGNEFDMLIRPILWKQLKVGTRIVSHRFVMGDWKPEKTLQIKGDDGDDYEIHLWTITKEVKDKAEKK
ncbi:hypothetical protein FRUB_08587 [Fimbriiglobus ruber]|uniref:Methyltransferase domain-containing protein n=1 Tax=Fimbriiglobus ruber TaxID=1908690 RepID=A0A225D8Q3_9BACT|nr:hypothetical protein FRUB_08587 [Fimbriiglobus ruber]